MKTKSYKRAKLMFIAFLAVCILFFSNDCQLIDVQKTAIIVALGIDEADGELEITAQVAIPQATDTQTSNSDAILTAKGKTLFDALDTIGITTGWYPKLAFCNLIIFGRSLLDKEFMPIIDYMLTSNRFVSSAILAAADGTAKEVLSSPTPLDYVSSFALQKILVRDIDRANTVLVTDIREFAQKARSPSGFSYMPLVKRKQTEDKTKGDSNNQEENDQSSSAVEISPLSAKKPAYKSIIATSEVHGGGATGKGGQDDQGNEKTVFDARSSLLFVNGKYACEISPEQTLFYNALKENVSEAFIDVSYEKNGKKNDSIVSIVGNEKKISLKIENGIPYFEACLKLYCKNEEVSADPETGKLAYYEIAPKECLEALSAKISETLTDLYVLSAKNGCDVFELKNYLYRHIPDKYPSLKDSVTTSAKVNFIVNCINKH